MKKLDLSWKLYYFEQGKHGELTPDKLADTGEKPIDAKVPGNAELDLINAGILPEDIFMGENILLAEKYECYEWWYVAEFDARRPENADGLSLVFDGVDCYADYYLNDEYIGESHNMFIPHKFDITNKVNDGKNSLCVHIKSPIIEEAKVEYTHFSSLSWWVNGNGVNSRKCPHSYGWDIMPRAVSAGIWKDVYLKTEEKCEIEQLYVTTRWLNDTNAGLNVMYQIKMPDSFYSKKLEVDFSAECGDSVIKSAGNISNGSNKDKDRHRISFPAGGIVVNADNIKKWWPKGYGEPNVYTGTFNFYADGELCASRTVKFGIRTVELKMHDITPDNPGEFRFLINGTEIFANGSNWVPLDTYHSRDTQRLAKALELVDDCGCNILRCWGGNVYGSDEFYDWCDEHGVMVWQDFAMACFVYPRTDEFCAEIKTEAESIIKRLRQHPSLILWSGDNECDESVSQNAKKNPALNKVTREVIRDAVINYDCSRPYLPSSPYISSDVYTSGGKIQFPEAHLWGPRDYYKGNFYVTSKAHFVSETGYHGCPSPESVKKFITPENVWPCLDNREWNLHSTDQKDSDARVMLMVNQIKVMFGYMPESLEEFSLLSQISQAEAKKFFVERLRINRPYATGVIWWNLLDGWPQMSDAVVDYYYDKKLAYYYLRNIENPVCMFVSETENGKKKLVASNNTLKSCAIEYRLYDAMTDETLLSGKINPGVNANALCGEFPDDGQTQRLLVAEWHGTSEGANHYLCGKAPYDAKLYTEKYLEVIKKLYGIDK